MDQNFIQAMRAAGLLRDEDPSAPPPQDPQLESAIAEDRKAAEDSFRRQASDEAALYIAGRGADAARRGAPKMEKPSAVQSWVLRQKAAQDAQDRPLERLGKLADVWHKTRPAKSDAGAAPASDAIKIALAERGHPVALLDTLTEADAQQLYRQKAEAPEAPLEPDLVERAKKSGVPTDNRKREPVVADILAAEREAAARDRDATKEKERTKGEGNKTEIELRREFIGQQGFKDFQQVAAAAEKIKSASASGAGDIALVYGFMKLMDPGSTVREGEFATAANAGSAWQRAGAWYNRVLNGEKLPPEVRKQFIAESRGVLDAQKRRYSKLEGEYRRLAKSYGADPDRVVPRLSVDEEFPRKTVNGKTYEQRPDGWYEVEP